MNQNEQNNLDRVFGRIHIGTKEGGMRPLNPEPIKVPSPVKPGTPQAKQPPVVPFIASKEKTAQEKSLLLRALKDLPEMPPNVTTSKPADTPPV